MAESSAVPSMNQVLGFDDRCEGGEWMEDLEASRNVAMAPPGCGKQGGGKAPNLHTVAQDDAQYSDEVKQIFERLGGTSSMAEIQDNLDKAPDKASLEDWLFGGCGGDAASSTIGGLGSRGEVPCKATSRTIPPLPPSP